MQLGEVGDEDEVRSVLSVSKWSPLETGAMEGGKNDNVSKFGLTKPTNTFLL